MAVIAKKHTSQGVEFGKNVVLLSRLKWQTLTHKDKEH